MDKTTTATTKPRREPIKPVSERTFYVGFGALVLLAASVPQIVGWFSTPAGYSFTGFPYNADDGAVYLSWMRQAEEGRFFLLNRFTTEPQKGVLFNLFFYLLGSLCRLPLLSAPLVYQLARVGCGALFLISVVGLLRVCFPESSATLANVRRTGFALVSLAGGFGWLFGAYDAQKELNQPVDLWQPEAIGFLSLYFAPLFTASLALMTWFMAAFLRAERSGKIADLWPCFVSGFLLGNFHTYDVVHLLAVVFVYRIASDITERNFDKSGWLRLICIGLAMLPTTAYTAYALRTETVLYERAFVSNTLSPNVVWVLLGFGLPLLLAVFETIRRARGWRTDAGLRLLIVWGVVGICVSFLPVSFQRKMLMGAQIPLCLLAGGTLVSLAYRLSGDFPKIALGVGVALTLPSNGLFLLRDMERMRENTGSTEHRPYLAMGERSALEWLRANGKPGEVVLCAPDPTSHKRFPFFPLRPYLSVWIPAWSSCTVYNGHWSETARFGTKMADANRFFSSEPEKAMRRGFLRENRIRYLLVPNALLTQPRIADGQGEVFYTAPPVGDLQEISDVAATFADVTIFVVRP